MLAAIAASILTLAAGHAARPAVSPRDSALAALERLANGPRPGDIEAVARQGVLRWIDHELDGDGPDERFERLARLSPLVSGTRSGGAPPGPRERLQLEILRACATSHPLRAMVAGFAASDSDLTAGADAERARRACRRLCARLIADPPPERAVTAATAAWRTGGGSVREAVRAITRRPEFWAEARARSQIKTSFEFAVSAIRALGADPDTTSGLADCVARLDSLGGAPTPAGTLEVRPRRLSPASRRARRDVAVALAAGSLAGAWVELDDVVPWPEGAGTLVDQANEFVAHGTLGAATRRSIARAVRGIRDPARAAARAAGLALASAEFQRR